MPPALLNLREHSACTTYVCVMIYFKISSLTTCTSLLLILIPRPHSWSLPSLRYLVVSLGRQFTDMEPRSLPLWNLSSHSSWIYRSRREGWRERGRVLGILVGKRESRRYFLYWEGEGRGVGEMTREGMYM